MIAGLLALTLIAIGAAGIAVRDAANTSRQHAIAYLASSRRRVLSSTHDLVTARRLAVAAWRVFPPTKPAPS